MLGLHWIGEGYECSVSALTLANIEQTLSIVPAALGLMTVSSPVLHSHADGSCAGVILLAESHLSLHCHTRDAWIHADLFSCVAFDTQHTKQLLTERFGVATWRESLLTRGVQAPSPKL